MKTTSLATLALAGLANAYPSIMAHLSDQAKAAAPNEKRQTPVSIPPFDAASQYVSNQGEHKFVAPGPTDQRGPCPGLNAMANHNYMPHNGIATIQQFIDGTEKVFGMGRDLGAFLAIFGAAVDGNAVSWSIGGPDPRVSIPLNLLGQPMGISGSHNKYESDNSPTRGDLYVEGNDYKLVLKRFQRLYDAGKAKDDYNLQTLTDVRAVGFQESIDTNPYFFNGPFPGVLVQPAAYTFIYRFMANKSAEYPQGKLNGEVLKSFFAITGEDGNFKYTEGHERIPDNWYKRNLIDEYTIPYFSLDNLEMASQHPEFLSVGGNTGKVDTFTGVDPSDLTGGVFNGATLLESNNLMCYVMQLAVQQLPDILSGLFTDVNPSQDLLGTELNSLTNSLGCPKLNNIDKGQFDKYPGYKNSYNGYSGAK